MLLLLKASLILCKYAIACLHIPSFAPCCSTGRAAGGQRVQQQLGRSRWWQQQAL